MSYHLSFDRHDTSAVLTTLPIISSQTAAAPAIALNPKTHATAVSAICHSAADSTPASFRLGMRASCATRRSEPVQAES